ncbi:MAG: polymer-forming cytoskeletal protein [Elusimicrobiota bacterium]
MFGKKENIGKIETIIAESAVIEGNMSSEGTIRVDGIVEGHISKSTGVIVGKTGKITGDLHSESIIIGGVISGNVFTLNSLELLSTAQVLGDIETQTLSIHQGAIFEGKCTMIKKEMIKNVDE